MLKTSTHTSAYLTIDIKPLSPLPMRTKIGSGEQNIACQHTRNAYVLFIIYCQELTNKINVVEMRGRRLPAT